MKKNQPLVSAQELEALIEGWGREPPAPVDRFFPMRVAVICVLSFLFVYSHLFETDWVARHLISDPLRLSSFKTLIVVKGLVGLLMLLLGLHAYLRNWHPGICFSLLFILALFGFVFDLFGIYSEIIGNPTPRFTMVILLRFFVIWFLFDSVRNSGRIPEYPDRLNIFLFLKK
jgi:hypothetical protein